MGLVGRGGQGRREKRVKEQGGGENEKRSAKQMCAVLVKISARYTYTVATARGKSAVKTVILTTF